MNDLAVVVLTYGSANRHPALVETLLAEGVDRDRVLLVHNPDGSPAGAAPSNAHGVRTLVMARNVGYSAAMNAGLDAVRSHGAEYVLLLTHDIGMADGALPALLAAAQRAPDAGVVGPVLALRGDGGVYSYGGLDDPGNIAAHIVQRPEAGPGGVAPCTWVDGSALLVATRAMDAVGPAPFDPRFFMYFDEAELCRRVRAAGWRVGVALEATFFTDPGQTRRPAAYGYLFCRNGLHYAWRSGGWPTLARAVLSQVRMSWWLAAKPYHRRFYRRDERRFGYAKALGMWLGFVAAAVGRWGPPPPRVRKLSDIEGT